MAGDLALRLATNAAAYRQALADIGPLYRGKPEARQIWRALCDRVAAGTATLQSTRTVDGVVMIEPSADFLAAVQQMRGAP